MPNLPRFVANSHLIEDDPVRPHIHGGAYPNTVCHFRCLVLRSAHFEGHVGHLSFWLNQMTEAKVNDFRHGTIFIFILVIDLLRLLLEDEDIVDFYIGVNDTTRVHVPDAIEHVLGPDSHLVILDWLVFTLDSSRDVVASDSRVLHVNVEMCLRL